MPFSLSIQEQELEHAVRAAGNALMSYWPGAPDKAHSELGAFRKSDGSFVTRADFASNDIVTAALSRLFPDDGILSEEIPPTPELHAKERLWIIDPLDGTQSFMNGNDDFSVLVALARQGIPDFGFMLFPARNKLAVGKRGAGAFVDGTPMKVSPSQKIRPESVYIRNFDPRRTDCVYPKWIDSGCAFMMLAEGVFDGLIIKIVSHREWDLAAPAVVVEESGGLVTDENGEKIRFYPGSMTYKYFVASNGAVHDELLKLIPSE